MLAFNNLIGAPPDSGVRELKECLLDVRTLIKRLPDFSIEELYFLYNAEIRELRRSTVMNRLQMRLCAEISGQLRTHLEEIKQETGQ